MIARHVTSSIGIPRLVRFPPPGLISSRLRCICFRSKSPGCSASNGRVENSKLGRLPAFSAWVPCEHMLQNNSLVTDIGIQQPGISSQSILVVHGISATCKSTIVRAVLNALEVPYAIVRSAECITGRHLLTKILWATLEALGRKDEWEKFGKGRCEHVSTLAVLLGECLASTAEKFVLVLDGIDTQREAPQTLLSAVARLGEVVSSVPTLYVPGY